MNTNNKIEDTDTNQYDKESGQNQADSVENIENNVEDFTIMKVGSEQVKVLWPLAIKIEDSQLSNILLKDIPIKYDLILDDREIYIYRPDEKSFWIEIRETYEDEGTVIGEQEMSVTLFDLIKEYLDYLNGKIIGKPKLFYRSEDFRPIPTESTSSYFIKISNNDFSSPMENNFCIDYKKVGDLNTRDLPKNIRFNFTNTPHQWLEEKKPTVMVENIRERVKITIIENPVIWEYADTWKDPKSYFIIKHDIMLRDEELEDARFILYRDRPPITKNDGDFIYEYYRNHDTIGEVYNRACQYHNRYHFDIDRAGEKSLRDLQRIFWITNKSDRLINSTEELIIPSRGSGTFCRANSEGRFDYIF